MIKMIWQDMVISTIGILFGVLLLPQLKDCIKEDLSLNLFSSSLTSVGLYIQSYTFFTLKLYLSTFSTAFAGTVWALIFFFSIKHR